MSKYVNQPAFPIPELRNPHTGDVIQQGWEGMSLRDWFAGMALQGMCANPDITSAMSEKGMKPFEIRESFASSAYAQADEMMEERESVK